MTTACGLTYVSGLFFWKLTRLLTHWVPKPILNKSECPKVGLEVTGHDACLLGKAAPIHGSRIFFPDPVLLLITRNLRGKCSYEF